MHVLLQKEKRAFESQIADQAVKIQCLEAADKVMKEEVTKMTARIRELELEEIRRTEEANAKFRELEAEVAESAERSAATERERPQLPVGSAPLTGRTLPQRSLSSRL